MGLAHPNFRRHSQCDTTFEKVSALHESVSSFRASPACPYQKLHRRGGALYLETCNNLTRLMILKPASILARDHYTAFFPTSSRAELASGTIRARKIEYCFLFRRRQEGKREQCSAMNDWAAC
jgi:hypothetical protein